MVIMTISSEAAVAALIAVSSELNAQTTVLKKPWTALRPSTVCKGV